MFPPVEFFENDFKRREEIKRQQRMMAIAMAKEKKEDDGEGDGSGDDGEEGSQQKEIKKKKRNKSKNVINTTGIATVKGDNVGVVNQVNENEPTQQQQQQLQQPHKKRKKEAVLVEIVGAACGNRGICHVQKSYKGGSLIGKPSLLTDKDNGDNRAHYYNTLSNLQCVGIREYKIYRKKQIACG
jgi:hypothetical protein